MKEKAPLGLDVGNSRINMVSLASEAEGLQLVDFATVALDPRGGREEKVKQLGQFVQEKGIAGFPANIGVSGDSVIVRYIDLPKMSGLEVAQALKYEAQQYIPFKMEEVIFDYHILEPPNSTRNRMRVLLVAAKKKVIIESIKLIQQAGLKPSLIDVNSFSLINCFQINGPTIKEDAVFALLNLEVDLVSISILQGQLPYFTRDISLLEDILSLRQERGQERDFLGTIRPFLTNLIREIRLSIDYYESEFEKQVYIIYLSGEGAKVPELINFFNEQLGRQLSLWNPMQNIRLDSARIDSMALKGTSCMLALACGLALRGAK